MALSVRIVVRIEEGYGEQRTKEFEFERDDPTHTAGFWTGQKVREVLHAEADRLADELDKLYGKAPE